MEQVKEVPSVDQTVEALGSLYSGKIQINLEYKERTEPGSKPQFVLTCKFIAPMKVSDRNKLRHELEQVLRVHAKICNVQRHKATDELRYTYEVAV